MNAVSHPTQDTSVPPAPEQDSGARRCLVCGDLKPRPELIRFVIGPDQAVVPDIAEKLPGHGLWVTATHDAITQAAKKNLFAKAAREPAKPALDLADLTTHLLRKRVCDLLGLAKGAGIAVLGETQTETALRGNKLALYLHAPDATRVLDNRFHVSECHFLSRDEMGAALGYDQIVYAGLAPHGLTEKVKLELSRLQNLLKKNEG